jgi:hypothetical protein
MSITTLGVPPMFRLLWLVNLKPPQIFDRRIDKPKFDRKELGGFLKSLI